MKCRNCRFTPCTVAQGVNCCTECEFTCSSMCELATQILIEKKGKNIMNVKTKKNTEKVAKTIEVTRAHQFDDGSITFDMMVNGVSIYGCRIASGKNGDFVSFPSRKGKDGKYYSHAYVALDDQETADIISQIEKL